MFCWVSAPKAPMPMDKTAMIQITSRHWSTMPPKGSTSTRASSTMAAIFGAVAKKAVTGVGAPS